MLTQINSSGRLLRCVSHLLSDSFIGRSPLTGAHPTSGHDLKTLKEGGQLTGDIASEISRRITDSAPHVEFLDDAFLEKVTPR